MNELEILKLTKRYALTGEIPDDLISFFSQDGRWLGDRRSWRRSTYVIALKRMRHAVLPAARRTARCRSGQRLLTSLVLRNRRPVVIPYCEVAGSIHVSADVTISAPHLRSVGRHFNTSTTALVDLPQLLRVGGDFHARASCELNARRLQRVDGDMGITGYDFPVLQVVGGRLSIGWGCRIQTPHLRSVGGTLQACAVSSFEAPLLQTVGGDLITASLTLVVAVPVLESIGGSLLVDWTEVIVAPRLTRVGGSIHSSHADRFIGGKIMIGGEWKAHPRALLQWRANEAAKEALRDPGIQL
ncbi:MAG: hypothetical protein H7A49_08135 [Akkermansiaceae bacterium]|nr:hypothetical protein [Akkermansiaceae bacterium]